ncbi:endonuclease/exonuclease/phosphatase family protein [Sphingomonas sp. CGMCC 1.13654]|uniref:Endonuclease/exonuclease/phosphatase family protein n=1 Tax=Sphingomonas chungangi TaxID=2683589 RepID=A0A838L2N0_9SPHN|nr:endonuclease/exonuclease/phosphatase family protein [Sphingomonas chungangi]MBA2933190.1 endonuclease/exonuclease/phosphatase family protein [Sphingomonas chungangi]MVW57862.1 endonuclease [Sphingomonas chungangi]
MSAAPKTSIKVASYNIRKAIGTDRQRRPERILSVLNELGADIVCLQEADRRLGARQSALPFEAIARETPYKAVPYEIRPGGMGWHGNAVLVRRDADILDHRPLTLPVLEPRGAVMAEIALHGQRLRVIGMHLDLSGLYRRRQARAVIEHVKACGDHIPTVLMGDLNEWSSGGCLRDFMSHFHFAPTGPSYHASRPIARLDRIMTTHDLAVLDAGTHHSPLAKRASDHLPIWAAVGLR